MEYLKNCTLFSQYRGPLLFNELKDEEEDAASRKSDEDDTEEAAGESDEDDSEGEGEGEGDDDNSDPLNEPNPYTEGSKEHKAFEKQREKFKKQLEAAKSDAEKKSSERIGAIEDKLDALLTASGGKKEEKKKSPEVEAADEDVEIVLSALRKKGFDVDSFLVQQRREQVKSALSELQTDYPDITFDAAELVKYANETGISKTGGNPKDILELAFLRKFKEKIRKGEGKKEKDAGKKKKSPVEISDRATGTDPETKGKSHPTINSWRQRMRKKWGGDTD